MRVWALFLPCPNARTLQHRAEFARDLPAVKRVGAHGLAAWDPTSDERGKRLARARVKMDAAITRKRRTYITHAGADGIRALASDAKTSSPYLTGTTRNHVAPPARIISQTPTTRPGTATQMLLQAGKFWTTRDR